MHRRNVTVALLLTAATAFLAKTETLGNAFFLTKRHLADAPRLSLARATPGSAQEKKNVSRAPCPAVMQTIHELVKI
jgi:hypothetical protein